MHLKIGSAEARSRVFREISTALSNGGSFSCSNSQRGEREAALPPQNRERREAAWSFRLKYRFRDFAEAISQCRIGSAFPRRRFRGETEVPRFHGGGFHMKEGPRDSAEAIAL
jgi:hypothetical protein